MRSYGVAILLGLSLMHGGPAFGAACVDLFRTEGAAVTSAFQREQRARLSAILELVRPGRSESALARSLLKDPYLRELRLQENDAVLFARDLLQNQPRSPEELIAAFHRVFPAVAAGRKKIRLDAASRYDFEIPHPTVRDQDSFFSCWAMASTCVAEMNQGQGAKLSHRFLYLNYLRSRMIELLDRPDLRAIDWRSDYDFHAGKVAPEKNPRNTLIEVGEFWKAVGFANEFGMIPDAIWTTQKPFEKPMNRVRLLARTKAIVNEYKAALRSLENDAPGAERARTRLREKAVAELNAVLRDHFGEPPSAAEVARARLPILRPGQQVVRVISRGSYEFRDEEYRAGIEGMKIYDERGRAIEMKVPVDVHVAEVDEIIAFITGNIRRSVENPSQTGNNAFFISYNIPKDSPRVTEDWSVGLMDLKPGAARPERYELRHAIVVTGFETDLRGNVIALKLLNSYGLESGDQGVFHMTDRFFREFLFDVVFPGSIQTFKGPPR